MTMPCWIISLNPNAERVVTLSQALTTAGISHSFVSAVDGRKSTPPLLEGESLDIRKSLLRHRRLLSNSELGCYLSHYRAIKTAYAQGHERVCILEDDVVLEPGFAQVLQALETQPEEQEMVRLMGLRIRKRKVIGPLTADGHQLVRPERGWCGTQGYVVNRRGMQKIIQHAGNIFEPIDKLYDHFWEYELKVYGVEPHVLYELDHPTSVAKAAERPTKIPLLLRVLAPLQKALFSRSRHAYLKQYANEFYPAIRPQGRIGNTARLR